MNPLNQDNIVQARIVTVACFGLGLAAVAVIGGWAIFGVLEDWETVLTGGVFIALLAGFALLARRGHPALAACLLAGLLFILVGADTTYYGLGSPSVMAFLLPVLLVSCTLGLKPGLAAAALAGAAVFGVAWASVSGVWATEMPVLPSHLSYNAPVISVILFICAGLAGYAIDAFRQGA